MPHQEKAIAYALERSHPAFILQMRLGKTLSLIRWVQALEDMKTCLIVCPLTVMDAWKTELFEDGEPFLDLHALKPAEREKAIVEVFESRHRVWVLANYAMLRGLPIIARLPWDLCGLDESTQIKNPQSQITKICLKGFRFARHRAILTGLIAPESELELFTQFQFLHGRFMNCSNYWDFKATYFEPDPMNVYDFRPKPGAQKAIKEALHSKAFVLTRAQAGMGSKKIYSKRYVEMSPEQRKLYAKIMKDWGYVNADGEWEETQWAMEASMWLQRMAGGFDPKGEVVLSDAKAKEILYLLGSELRGEQLVVWFKFRAELALVEEVLRSKRISFASVHGGHVQEEREKAIRRFRTGQARVFLATEKCARYGLDCSTADTEIYYSNEWSAEDRAQSEDRIVHPTKKNPVLCIDLVTRGTIDPEIVDRIHDKTFNAKQLMLKYVSQWRKLI